MSECDSKIRFGTAGTSDSFEAKGYKSSLDIPAYTAIYVSYHRARSV